MKLDKSQTVKLIVSVLVVVLALLCLGGLLGGKDLMYHLQHRGDLGPLTRSDIEYLEVDAPEATSKDGTVTAADWAAVYPYIAVSMGDNEKNSYVTDYLEQDPYLTNIYEGYGFAIDYGSARGHFYDVDDILETGRPHKLAQCWTCKTPDFTHYVNEHGPEAYQMEFDKMGEMITEGVSCYTCHANTPGEITVTHTYVMDALGEDWNQVSAADLACGQCHVEYYFYPGTGVTSLPRFDLKSILTKL